MATAIIILWLVAGFIGFLIFHRSQRNIQQYFKWNYNDDKPLYDLVSDVILSVLTILMGPIGLMLTLTMSESFTNDFIKEMPSKYVVKSLNPFSETPAIASSISGHGAFYDSLVERYRIGRMR